MILTVYTKMVRSAIHMSTTFSYFNPIRSDPCFFRPSFSLRTPPVKLKALYATNAASERTAADKPSICTADELHYVSVHNSDWRLALWRYKPSPKVFSLYLYLCICIMYIHYYAHTGIRNCWRIKDIDACVHVLMNFKEFFILRKMDLLLICSGRDRIMSLG